MPRASQSETVTGPQDRDRESHLVTYMYTCYRGFLIMTTKAEPISNMVLPDHLTIVTLGLAENKADHLVHLPVKLVEADTQHLRVCLFWTEWAGLSYVRHEPKDIYRMGPCMVCILAPSRRYPDADVRRQNSSFVSGKTHSPVNATKRNT